MYKHTYHWSGRIKTIGKTESERHVQREEKRAHGHFKTSLKARLWYARAAIYSQYEPYHWSKYCKSNKKWTSNSEAVTDTRRSVCKSTIRHALKKKAWCRTVAWKRSVERKARCEPTGFPHASSEQWPPEMNLRCTWGKRHLCTLRWNQKKLQLLSVYSSSFERLQTYVGPKMVTI